jgi:preprotein translocase subunit SecE
MGIVNYIKESFRELKEEVTWISFPEAQKTTIVVAIFTILFALAVFFTDKSFEGILDKFFTIFN